MSSQSSRNVRTQPPTTLMGIHHSPSIRNRILLKDKRRRVVPPSFSPYKCVEEPSKVVMDSTVASTVKLPVDAHVNDSKELLHFESFVRNRHNEIDWVATFLRVGFEASSIYALLCPLRKGRWKAEEEQYTMGLLRLIENGTIILRHGQSIRGYISEKLHSDDMRVLKKLSNCKMFHFAKLIHPRLAKGETLDMNVVGSLERLERLEKLKMEFLRSVQLEALVAVRKYLSDGSVQHTDVFK
ncbi:hypothetical protein PsorP6_019281 [Peronosclerospora sorghi]|nr:hypothetical protein PsorP6_019280 [Peronosclerospora sorghi]KAI9895928.1 hypothetical protein PsorP6_019281 [Peronosclerospora sorghi]